MATIHQWQPMFGSGMFRCQRCITRCTARGLCIRCRVEVSIGGRQRARRRDSRCPTCMKPVGIKERVGYDLQTKAVYHERCCYL